MASKSILFLVLYLIPPTYLPAFLTIFFIPMGFSIAAGLSAGLITYPVLKTFKGQAREVPLVTWVLAVIFVIRFVFMTLRFG